MIYEVNNLSFSYQKEKKVLKNVDFTINKGELVVFLGKNGSGKSTLFSLLMGLNKDYEGVIKLNGEDLVSLSERDVAKLVGYVPQSHSPTFGFSVKDFVLLGCAPHVGLFSHPSKEDEKNALKAIKEMGIEKFRDRNYSELSGGERQQAVIARALASKPKMVIFDEPTTHLDYANQIKVLRIIKELNKKGYTIAVSSHDPNHALMLDGNVVLLDGKGKLQKGTAREMITEENLKRIYNANIKIRYNEEFKCKVCILTI